MSQSTNLYLPYLAAGQAQKHVTVNESLLRLDAIVQLAIVSATLSAEPDSPSDGAVYILPAGKTGTHWGGMSNHALAYWRDGAWEEITPREGWLAFDQANDTLLHFTGAAWALLAANKTLSLSASDRVLGRASSGAGPAEEITFTAPARQLCDDASFAAMRATLGAAAVGANSFTGDQTLGNGAGVEAALVGSINNNVHVLGGFLRFTANSAGSQRIWASISDPNGLVGTLAAQNGQLQINPATTLDLNGALDVSGALVVGAPTGGAKGAGTINATAVYDDNVLLTCGPVELMREGAVDLAKWDRLAPGGRHRAMHAFAAMRAQGFDPRDADNYCARMAADGAAPGLYTEAEWRELGARGEKPDIGSAMTRVFLALDNLAVAFDAALKRIAALEERLGR